MPGSARPGVNRPSGLPVDQRHGGVAAGQQVPRRHIAVSDQAGTGADSPAEPRPPSRTGWRRVAFGRPVQPPQGPPDLGQPLGQPRLRACGWAVDPGARTSWAGTNPSPAVSTGSAGAPRWQPSPSCEPPRSAARWSGSIQLPNADSDSVPASHAPDGLISDADLVIPSAMRPCPTTAESLAPPRIAAIKLSITEAARHAWPPQYTTVRWHHYNVRLLAATEPGRRRQPTLTRGQTTHIPALIQLLRPNPRCVLVYSTYP